MTGKPLHRRDFGAAALALTGAAFATPQLAQAAAPVVDLPSDPALQNSALVRLKGRTDDGETVWSSRSRIYAVTDDAVLKILETRGAGRSWWRRLDEHVYQEFQGSLSYFHDPGTGAVIDSFVNPLTGRTVPLTTSSQRRQDGEIYTPNGSYFPISRERFPDMYDDKPLALDWAAENGVLKIHRYENFAPVARQPIAEAHMYFGPVDQVLDPAVTHAPGQSVTWFISSFSRWLDMADVPGRMLWQFESIKLASLDQLDPDFLTRARALDPRFDISPEFDEGPSYIERVEQQENADKENANQGND